MGFCRGSSKPLLQLAHAAMKVTSLPQAVATMLDLADCGPAFIGLPQDTQEIAWDYPAAFFEKTVHEIARARPDRRRMAGAVALLKSAKRPLIISGGGVRYSGAEEVVAQFAIEHGIPLTETIAGKSTVPHGHPAYAGPLGIVGSTSANALAAEADVILAIGTRLMDFTTGSWTVFNHDARFVSIDLSARIASLVRASAPEAAASVVAASALTSDTAIRRLCGWARIALAWTLPMRPAPSSPTLSM